MFIGKDDEAFGCSLAHVSRAARLRVEAFGFSGSFMSRSVTHLKEIK
jgi:hypothetical protein